jgi:hypothetical protein
VNKTARSSSFMPTSTGRDGIRWWERPSTLLAVALISMVPLLWPEIPPLVDVPGHIGRYRVELDLQSSADLQRYYDFRWALIGNLGVDLLILPLAPLLGLEAAVKLVVVTIPALTVLGIFAVSREVHGRVPPTAFFAVPFVYSYPFIYGFINFALSAGLSLIAFALWLRFDRTGHLRARAIAFVPISCLLWLMHAFGWGMLGLLAYSSELIRFRERGFGWQAATIHAVVGTLPLCGPVFLMLIWRNGAAGGATVGFLYLPWKLLALFSSLRDRWLLWDSLGVAVPLILIGTAALDKRFGFSRKLFIPATIFATAFLLLPYRLFGSAHADMRLAPYAILIAVLAINLRDQSYRFQARVALLGFLFILFRVSGNAVSLFIGDLDTREKLEALKDIPQGAAVLTLAASHCSLEWNLPRHWHLGGLIIARKNGFSNDQWQIPGAQLLSVRYTAAEPFHDVRSSLVFSTACAKKINHGRHTAPVNTIERSLSEFPRNAFDYVWLIEPPDPSFKVPPDLKEVWRGRDSLLYEVESPSRPPQRLKLRDQ